jgi:hypothetical protein
MIFPLVTEDQNWDLPKVGGATVPGGAVPGGAVPGGTVPGGRVPGGLRLLVISVVMALFSLVSLETLALAEASFFKKCCCNLQSWIILFLLLSWRDSSSSKN